MIFRQNLNFTTESLLTILEQKAILFGVKIPKLEEVYITLIKLGYSIDDIRQMVD